MRARQVIGDHLATSLPNRAGHHAGNRHCRADSDGLEIRFLDRPKCSKAPADAALPGANPDRLVRRKIGVRDGQVISCARDRFDVYAYVCAR